MKFFITLVLLYMGISCLAQVNSDQVYTLDPASSRIIGGSFALGGNSSWDGNGNAHNNLNLHLGPYFSVKRSEKKDLLVRTDIIFSTYGNGDPSSFQSSLTALVGLDWRHELYRFNKFKVLASCGPRIGAIISTNQNETTAGFQLEANGRISLAYEFTPNLRLLTSLLYGSLQYSNPGDSSNKISYSLRNYLLSPNFSIEYILPRKR